MLKDAATNAAPTKYVQNSGQGMNLGTPCMMPLAAAKCSAPKTASGRAKHRLARATNLSRPRACATSPFVASTAITKSTIAAAQVETTVRDISKKTSPGRVLAMVAYMIYERGPNAKSSDSTHRCGKSWIWLGSVVSRIQGKQGLSSRQRKLHTNLSSLQEIMHRFPAEHDAESDG